MVRAWAAPAFRIRRVPTYEIVGQVSGRSTRSCSLLKLHRPGSRRRAAFLRSHHHSSTSTDPGEHKESSPGFQPWVLWASRTTNSPTTCFQVDPADATRVHSPKKRKRHRFPATPFATRSPPPAQCRRSEEKPPVRTGIPQRRDDGGIYQKRASIQRPLRSLH